MLAPDTRKGEPVMTRTDTASLYDAAITQAERLVGLCDAEAVSLPEAIVGFERLVDLLRALGLRLPHGKQMTQLPAKAGGRSSAATARAPATICPAAWRSR